MLKSYHFSVGNSTTGKIGYCARLSASSPEEAVRLLNEALEPHGDGAEIIDRYEPIEYVTVYFGFATIEDIDEVNEIEGQEAA